MNCIFLDKLEQNVESLQVENNKLQIDDKKLKEENEILKEENKRIRSRLRTIEKQNAMQTSYFGSKLQTAHEHNEEIKNYTHRPHNTKEHKTKVVDDIAKENYHYKRLLIENTSMNIFFFVIKINVIILQIQPVFADCIFYAFDHKYV